MQHADNSRKNRRPHRPSLSWSGTVAFCLSISVIVLAAGCTAKYHKRDADREVYGIIGGKEKKVHGKETGFNIDTPYSKREPKDIKQSEIISDRIQDGDKALSLEESLRIAVGNSRTYQLRKETLYLSAL